ncbi:MAG: hypothetical protein HUU21_12955 [Polyangiaceae bacterium]|nr:hypothetical protein [Polyangiaceae bacterium]
MVDTNVLVFGCRTIKPTDADDLKGWCADSKALLHAQPFPIRVCAVAWMEFLRGHRAEEQASLSAISRKIVIEPVDGSVVERAVALLKARNITEKRCRKCQTWDKATACDLCKRFVSAKQNLNDAIIAASAELHDTVDTLYCYDGDAAEFGPYMDAGKCAIRRPPNHIGPLYEKAGRPQ